MDDQTIIESAPGERPEPGLFAPAPGEGERENAYAMRSTGQVALRLEDAEFDLDHDGAGQRAGWRMHALAALAFTGLTVALGFAAGYPGPASGLVPLPMGVIPFAATAAAVASAVAAFVFWMGAVKRAANGGPARGASRLSRRALFVGSGAYAVSVGREGLAVGSARKRFIARWTAFHGPDLYATDMHAGFPVITEAEANGVTLDDIFGGRDDHEGLNRLLASAADWARSNTVIRLPLKSDETFAVRKTRKGVERAVARVSEREYLRLPRSAFDTGESDLTWPRFVAACVLMIAKTDPSWPHRLDPA
ncbi:MAG: hypothetical protein ABL308_07485 [Oceanicaulis sp.]